MGFDLSGAVTDLFKVCSLTHLESANLGLELLCNKRCVFQHFQQLPFEKGKARIATHLTLSQFTRRRIGQVVYVQSNRVLQ